MQTFRVKFKKVVRALAYIKKKLYLCTQFVRAKARCLYDYYKINVYSNEKIILYRIGCGWFGSQRTSRNSDDHQRQERERRGVFVHL